MNAEMTWRDFLLRHGTNFDAAMVPAPSSTKYADSERDLERLGRGGSECQELN